MLWMEVTDACEQLLLARLRRKVGPDGDLAAAYRRWQADYRQEHDRTMFRLMERLGRCEASQLDRAQAVGRPNA
jgi:hypothetical protein